MTKVILCWFSVHHDLRVEDVDFNAVQLVLRVIQVRHDLEVFGSITLDFLWATTASACCQVPDDSVLRRHAIVLLLDMRIQSRIRQVLLTTAALVVTTCGIIFGAPSSSSSMVCRAATKRLLAIRIQTASTDIGHFRIEASNFFLIFLFTITVLIVHYEVFGFFFLEVHVARIRLHIG